MRAVAGPLAALLLLISLSTPGCAGVPAWNRGRLAKPHMALDSDPAQRELQQHTYRSREAAAISAVGKGGGCGCY